MPIFHSPRDITGKDAILRVILGFIFLPSFFGAFLFTVWGIANILGYYTEDLSQYTGNQEPPDLFAGIVSLAIAGVCIPTAITSFVFLDRNDRAVSERGRLRKQLPPAPPG